jgi:hypothetical protein
MAIPATQMRPGMVIKHNNELHSVFSVEHRTPGNSAPAMPSKGSPSTKCRWSSSTPTATIITS